MNNGSFFDNNHSACFPTVPSLCTLCSFYCDPQKPNTVKMSFIYVVTLEECMAQTH